MNQSNQPLVSVVIPCYNHENFVQDCIQSVIDQTYDNIELIIIDDGSKDNSVDKIKEMIGLCEKRFTNFEIDKIKTEVEQIYQVWNTVSIDLYSLSINNNAILTFNDGLNKATQAVKAKNKANAMNEITGIYGKILE